MAHLKARRLYANIHTDLYPAGELRGQVVTGEALALFRSHLSGTNEVPPLTSLADGVVLLEVLKDSIAEASGSFRNLGSALADHIAGGAHIHNNVAGRNGAILSPLAADTDSLAQTGRFEAENNNFIFTESQLDQLFNRRLYTNIHSENHPGGEIRGQLLPEGQSVFNAELSSTQSVPEVYSGATGDVKAELSGNRLTVSGSFDDLGSEFAPNIAGGAHIHLGLAGETGGITFELFTNPDAGNLGGVFPAASNVFELDSAQIQAFKDRRYYVNVHTLSQPSGEIRGQLLHQATTYLLAPLSGASEPASVNTPGRGMAVAEISGSKGYVSGSFQALSSIFNHNVAGGAHIHRNIAGRNGGIQFPLHAEVNADSISGRFEVAENVLTLTPGAIDSMLMRLNYVNIHTGTYPSGEIRGQLMPLATQYFTSTLRGRNEVALVTTPGAGDLKLELTGNVLTVHGSFNNLSSPFNPNVAGGAHLHIGAPGTNGPIFIELNPAADANNLGGIFRAADNVYELDSVQIAALANGNFYANIHTEAYPSGEIRGQILKETNSYPAAETHIVSPVDGATLTVEGDPATSLNIEWLPGFEPDGNAQVYIWQLAADAAFASIIFQTYAPDNTYTLTYADLDALLAAAGLAVGDSITLYHRALGSDGSLAAAGNTASVTLIRGNLMQSEGVDLELAIAANVTSYTQYVDVTYSITVINTGNETATGVSVAASLPDGMVHTFNFTDHGDYNLYFEIWNVGTLAPGETATLTLVLFPLVNNTDLTNFVQVLTQDQPDADSAPGNDVGETPDEDDEAAVTVAAPTLPPTGGITSDLELSASADNAGYGIYQDIHYTLTLVNNGPDDAANINVAAPLPQGTVHTSNSATDGQYNLFFQRWEMPFLAAGETATLDLVLFPLANTADLTNFFEVLTSDQNDPDSAPGNGVCCTPQEDDEAVVTVTPTAFTGGPGDEISVSKISVGHALLFPNPASLSVKIQWVNEPERTGAHLAITDQTGRLVALHRTDMTEGFNETELDVSGLAGGVYFVKIPGGEVLRFVKM